MCDGSICLVFFFHLAKEDEVEHNSVLRIKHIQKATEQFFSLHSRIHKDDNEPLNAQVHRTRN